MQINKSCRKCIPLLELTITENRVTCKEIAVFLEIYMLTRVLFENKNESQ